MSISINEFHEFHRFRRRIFVRLFGYMRRILYKCHSFTSLLFFVSFCRQRNFFLRGRLNRILITLLNSNFSIHIAHFHSLAKAFKSYFQIEYDSCPFRIYFRTHRVAQMVCKRSLIPFSSIGIAERATHTENKGRCCEFGECKRKRIACTSS